MKNINTIYYNKFGIAFSWKTCAAEDKNKVQLVFRDTGLYLNYSELKIFLKQIEATKNASPCSCANCEFSNTCRAMLLETPNPQISFAISREVLSQIYDLLQNTIFQLQLDQLYNALNIYQPKS